MDHRAPLLDSEVGVWCTAGGAVRYETDGSTGLPVMAARYDLMRYLSWAIEFHTIPGTVVSEVISIDT